MALAVGYPLFSDKLMLQVGYRIYLLNIMEHVYTYAYIYISELLVYHIMNPVY